MFIRRAQKPNADCRKSWLLMCNNRISQGGKENAWRLPTFLEIEEPANRFTGRATINGHSLLEIWSNRGFGSQGGNDPSSKHWNNKIQISMRKIEKFKTLTSSTISMSIYIAKCQFQELQPNKKKKKRQILIPQLTPSWPC